MTRLQAASATILACLVSLALAATAAGQPLPTDPRLVTGTLDNGLSYIVIKHDNPPGRASVWLHVDSGSLNETDIQRGIAHYLEHMAFNGSKNFPPGSVVPFFESLGLTFGRHQNAFTSFDQTTYQLALPDAQPEHIAKALLFMSDVAMRLDLVPEEIEKERQVILEEKRARSSAGQRIQEYMLSNIAPGSIVGDRLPIGTEKTILGVQRQDFVDYYTKFYTPSNMTVMVVADADPAVVVAQIKSAFADGPKAPRPADQDPKVSPTSGFHAIIATDPDLTDASVSIMRLEPVLPPTTTVELARREMVERLGVTAFNRRIDAKISKGGMAFLDASVGLDSLFRTATYVNASADGKPENWKAMLEELGAELQRARLHGFTAREIDDVKVQIRSSTEQFVKREPTLDARVILNMLNRSIADGEPVMSAQQTLDLVNQLLPTITAEEVSKKFAADFDMTSAMFMLNLPSSAETPTKEALVALGKAAISATPEKEAESERAAALMTTKPTPGQITEQGVHEASGVWSGWLSNGVRAHQKSMDFKKDEVTVTFTLAAGAIQETAKDRGIAEAAGLAWSRPATGTLSSTDIRDLMTGKKVRVRGGGGGSPDTMTLSVSGSPSDLETGMQLAYLLLTDPVIEAAAFDQWRTAELQAIEARKKDPQGAFRTLMIESIYPASETRFLPQTEAQVNAMTREAAQAWLKKTIATAPIEVSIVGDMPQDQAMELLRAYVAALPARARISGSTLDELRKVSRPAGPVVKASTVDTKTPAAVVLGGFFGPDADNIPDARAMDMAAKILSTRMIKQIREEQALVYSIGAQSQPARVVPGLGLFFAFAPTKPEKVPALEAALKEVFDEFAKTGPTEEEMVVAKKQFANTFDESMKQPQFWLGETAAMDYRSANLNDVVSAPEAFQAMTADQVHQVFSKYYKPEAQLMISLSPSSAAADSEAASTPEPVHGKAE
ncbi:MAG: insulinase family protein [Phycisphaeraceae bacterium]|nr:insulinase family protein [Phycisphaeraceae bacterium]